jgi:hypothetical protein
VKITNRIRPTSGLALAIALTCAALTADTTDHRSTSESFGVSGGNINDRSRAFCCSGTLGSLVKDATGELHILSNNHVLARTDQALLGEDISQPGMIDYGCRVAEIVADLSAYPTLGSSNVDAAVASLRTGTMRTDGHILGIGIPASTTAPPAVGLGVAKSGRTTGVTTSTIGAINASVNVQYQQGCGGGRRFVIAFTNQIVISSDTFSAGGDSGSLIVTDPSQGTPQPVGLLFAGSSTTTIANPIDEVLSRVGTALGRSVSFDLVGMSTTSTTTSAGSTLSPQEIARGTNAKEAHVATLMRDPSVVAVGVGEDLQNPGRAAVVIFVLHGVARAAIARELDGVPTRIVETDPIVAFGWNEPEGTSCSVQ